MVMREENPEPAYVGLPLGELPDDISGRGSEDA